MKTLFLPLALLLLVSPLRAYVLVEDIPALTHNAINEVKNYAQYVEQTANQVTQITNQLTGLEYQIVQLERFGNPQYYVNLLGLDSFMSTASVLTSGVGQTISAYRQAANGLQALQYTGNGLYSNLTGTVDRWGNPVRYQPDAFRKFGALNDMLESYNTGQRTYDSQMASLQQQLATALQNLNSSRDLVSTEKYKGQIEAIHAQITSLASNTHLNGQRASIQQLGNQNDAARVQEASREQEIQEHEEDLRQMARGFGDLCN